MGHNGLFLAIQFGNKMVLLKDNLYSLKGLMFNFISALFVRCARYATAHTKRFIERLNFYCLADQSIVNLNSAPYL